MSAPNRIDAIAPSCQAPRPLPEEAAAITAAVEQFERELTPAPPPPTAEPPWWRAALREGVGASTERLPLAARSTYGAYKPKI